MRWWGLMLMLFAAFPAHAQDTPEAVHVERMKALNKATDADSLQRYAEHLLTSVPKGPSAVRQEAEFYEALALQLNDDPMAAMEHAQQAVLISRALKDTSRILRSTYLIMKLNVEGRHYEEADRNRRDNLALARAYGKDPLELARALNAIGSMHSRMQRSDSAEHYYRDGLRVLGDRSPSVRMALLTNLASTVSLNGRHEDLPDALEVFPVPAHDAFTVKVGPADIGKPAVVELFDASGRSVHARTFPALASTFDLELPTGIQDGGYVLSVRVQGAAARTTRVTVAR